MKSMKVSLKKIKKITFIVFCLFRIKQVCIIVMNERNSVELASADRLLFRMRPVLLRTLLRVHCCKFTEDRKPPGVLLPEG